MRPEKMPLNFLLDRLSKINLPDFGGFKSMTPVGGGTINDTFRLNTDKLQFFIKVNSASQYPDMFELEKDGLSALRNSNSFRIPEIYLVEAHAEDAFLVMEFIAEGTKGPGFWQNFGIRLASLHRTGVVDVVAGPDPACGFSFNLAGRAG